MITNLNKSLYGLVQSPLYWYNHLKGNFEARGFKPSPMDPFTFYGRCMIALIYFDDVIFFVTDKYKIDEFIKELEDSGILLIFEEDVYAFLRFEVKTDEQ